MTSTKIVKCASFMILPGEASKSVRPSKGSYGVILKDTSDNFFSSESLNYPLAEETGFIKNKRRAMEKSVVKVTKSGSKNHESSDCSEKEDAGLS